MAGRIFTIICSCLSLTLMGAAQVPNYSVGKPSEKKEKGETSPPKTEEVTIVDVATLLADNDGFLKNSKKLSEYTREINKSMGFGVVTEEDLEYPAIDLYGSESWHDNAVNPFIGSIKAEMPDSFLVDLTQFVYPLDELKRVNSRFGYRRRFRRMHYGIDISVRVGDTIRAAFDGKVRMIDYDRRGYGHYIVVRHPNGLETLYAHNSRILAKEDQVVRAGDPIALGGNTGRSTGPHLHFETRFMGQAINPEHLIDFATGVPQMEEYLCLATKYKGGRGKAIARSSADSTSKGVKMYRIRKGDTLSGIAQRHGTSVRQLCRLNNLSASTTLRIGRSIRVR